ncbi:MAG: DUF1643 domain-containing protein [Bacteroidaceae bacterium]|nr:DUF1643 domain-containing protein [Bacteroidaceae bacterium]
MDWIDIQEIGYERVRYALFKPGENTLFVIGVNPSTANSEKPDPTMRKVMGFAEANGFDSFCMLNLYPQRTADPDLLHEKYRNHYVQKNYNIIHDKLMAYIKKHGKVTILCAWGNSVVKRIYLLGTAANMYIALDKEFKDKIEWKMIRFSKEGHPIHPLTFKEKYGPFKDFDPTPYFVEKGTELLPKKEE